MVPLSPVFFKPFCVPVPLNPAAIKTPKYMLDYWYKEKRTLADFRRGPLGPYLDGFAAYLQARGYSPHHGRTILGKCCQFNAFLVEKHIINSLAVRLAHRDAFLAAYFAHVKIYSPRYCPRGNAYNALGQLFDYLIQIKAMPPPKPERVLKPYTWLVESYTRHLRVEVQIAERSIKRSITQVSALLDTLGGKARRERFKTLNAEFIEASVKEQLQSSTDPYDLASSLRRFLRYCWLKRWTRDDFSGLVPLVRRYRHASLPKGMEDSALELMLKAIPRNTEIGARDYAIVVLLMAYGIRGISAAQLLLEDMDWQRSRIRIRARKGGKEVVLPLMQAVGEALMQYLQYRPAQSPWRQVFLNARAPYGPLDSGGIAMIVRRCLTLAGIKLPGSGVRTLRHSWAIRALAHDIPIKAIADVLGHRYIDTTFIYAKADLKSLRQVAMPWPMRM
jgi:site-specific recombinase XerD